MTHFSLLAVALIGQHLPVVSRTIEADCRLVESKMSKYILPSSQKWSFSSSRGTTQATKSNVIMSFADKADYKLMRISFSTPGRTIHGPRQGLKFENRTEWEHYAFGLVSKIWSDIDGYVITYRATGEVSTMAGGRKVWASDSNTIFIVWKTHPVRGLQRQFSCSMDAATGALKSMSCSPFFKNAPAKLQIKFDNSKLRKTKVSPPPPGMFGKPSVSTPPISKRG